MALYTFEEICNAKGLGECLYSHWHKCEKCNSETPKFCHCEEGHESSVNFTRGECEYWAIDWWRNNG